MANRRTPSKRNPYKTPEIQERRNTRRAAVRNEMIFPTAYYVTG